MIPSSHTYKCTATGVVKKIFSRVLCDLTVLCLLVVLCYCCKGLDLSTVPRTSQLCKPSYLNDWAARTIRAHQNLWEDSTIFLSRNLSHLPPCNKSLTLDRTFLGHLTNPQSFADAPSLMHHPSTPRLREASGRRHFLPLGSQGEIEVEMLVDSGHLLVHRLDCDPWVLRAAIFSWFLGFFNHLVSNMRLQPACTTPELGVLPKPPN